MEPLELNNLKIYPIILPTHHNLKSFNCYLVEFDESLYLIDAGINSEDSWNLLNDALHTHGFKLSDLTSIYITHHHSDHVGLIDRIVEIVPIPVYAHEKAIPRLKRDPEFLQRRVNFFTNFYEEMGCGEAGEKQVNNLKSSIVKNKHLAINADITSLATGLHPFSVIEVPGHSPDQVAFFHKDSKSLFAGDLLINHIASNALIEPDENGKQIASLLEQMASLKKCLSYSIKYVFSGHGKMIEHPEQLIETRLNNIERKALKILSLIKAGATTGSEIAEKFYKKSYETQFSLVMSEIIGHLDYLEANKKVRTEKIAGVRHYFLSS